MIRILFCGGGSLGHLAPNIAVWETLKEKEPSAKALFVCSTKKDDRKFLHREHVRFVPLIAPRANTLLRRLALPILFPIGCLEALMILTIFRPHVIFAKGGYVSVPLCLVGRFLFRPIVLHESDRMMGRANRLLLKFARHLCIGAPEKDIANTDVMMIRGLSVHATGNPVRKILTKGTRDGGMRVTKFSGKRPVLLVIGGSQGAEALNRSIWQNLESLIDLCDVVHIAGRGKMNPKKRHGRYMQCEVLYDELEHIYALADVVLSRAGAGAIAELAATGKAAILVPLPDNVQLHQGENARFLRQANAVIVLDQISLEHTLVPTMRNLLSDAHKRRDLGERLRAFADPDAADRVANILVATARGDV